MSVKVAVMMAESTGGSHQTVPVERLRPGDHSCLAFADVEARWQVLTTYTRTGLARGEKVLLILDPDDLGDDDVVAHMDCGSGHVEAARDSGQLVLERNTSVYLPDGRFDKDRQVATYAAVAESCKREGWPWLRGAADMSWALKPGVDFDEVVAYEAFFEPMLADSRLSAICWYDQRQFSDHMVAAVGAVHPIQVMERLDAVHVTRFPNGRRIAGSAELSTRAEFVEALRETLKQRDALASFHFELDLTDLCFMEAYCAGQLISFAAALPEGSKVTVRCGPMLELVLRSLGSDAVSQLRLSVQEEP
ncbi:MEDS domain-containing protein [Amycolatopsis sp. EV170708-02-1]|uniref:MEDS domain-containing protein n=1 Tax=Amycolatopsis sp. EV170708-02-1 TaxID=2919322 RepID=UPI001F0C6014|nr:MEDS domain-containing protein [Amycolatopsis sp. EV170708-02-1]UMP06781.1 MEDS domain-containing protein [Amycolatopsis sp. EV170708-02-1]